LIPVTLLPIINPVANASVFMAMTDGKEALGRRMGS
jgi:small neutral amino acid transporter SnatA (MarC family)